jgi:hypothetical protein
MLAPHYSPSLAAYGQRLRDTPWSAAMRCAWATLLACIFLKLILPAAWVHALHRLLNAAPLFPFAAKDLAHFPDALARTRTALARRDWRALSVAWLAPELAGLLRLGSETRRGCMGWLLRRPRPALPPGQVFGYLERSAYGTAIAVALIALLVEFPIDGAIASLFVKNPGRRLLMHGLMLCAGLSSLVWVLGDRWLLGAGRHVLDDEALHLRVGARTRGTIARHAIRACEPLDVPRMAWCRSHGIDPRRTLLASPLDKPNTVLILEQNSSVRLTHLGVQRTGLSCVFLYLDSPHALAAALDRT